MCLQADYLIQIIVVFHSFNVVNKVNSCFPFQFRWSECIFENKIVHLFLGKMQSFYKFQYRLRVHFNIYIAPRPCIPYSIILCQIFSSQSTLLSVKLYKKLRMVFHGLITLCNSTRDSDQNGSVTRKK